LGFERYSEGDNVPSFCGRGLRSNQVFETPGDKGGGWKGTGGAKKFAYRPSYMQKNKTLRMKKMLKKIKKIGK